MLESGLGFIKFSFIKWREDVEGGFICQIDLNRSPILMVEVERKGTKELRQRAPSKNQISNLTGIEGGIISKPGGGEMQDNKVLIEFRRQKKAGRTISKIELVDLKNIG